MKKRIGLSILVLMVVFSFAVMAEGGVERKTKIKNLQSELEKVNVTAKKVEILKKLGILYHREAALGNEAAVNKAINCLEKAQNFSDSSSIKAWYGSALTLKARYSFVFGKMYYSKKGIDILDEVIKNIPDNVEVRLIRGINSLYLPNFIFHRLDLAGKDLKYIIQKAKNDPRAVSDKQLVTAHLNLGKYYRAKDELKLAKKEWEKVINLGYNQIQTKRAEEYIAKLDKQ